MFARVASQVSRRAFSTSRAGIEKVKNLQAKFQANPHLHGADDPTYLKNGSSDKVVFGAMVTFVGVSFLQILGGVVQMAKGGPE